MPLRTLLPAPGGFSSPASTSFVVKNPLRTAAAVLFGLCLFAAASGAAWCVEDGGLAIRVFDQRTGQGIDAATIRADSESRTDLRRSWTGTTDERGETTVPGDLARRLERLTVRAAGYEGRDLQPSGESDTLEVALDPLSTITGVVRDGRGSTVVGADVLLLRYRTLAAAGIEQPFPNLELIRAMRLWHTSDVSRSPTSVRTDSEGRFWMRVPPGIVVDVVARRDDLGCVRTHLDGLAAGATEVIEPVIAPFTAVRGVAPPGDGFDGRWLVSLFAVSEDGMYFTEEARAWRRPDAGYEFRDIGAGPKVVVFTRLEGNTHEIRWLETNIEAETTRRLPVAPLRDGTLQCASDWDAPCRPTNGRARLTLTFVPAGNRGCSVFSRGRFDPAQPLVIRGLDDGSLTLRAQLEESPDDEARLVAHAELAIHRESERAVLRFGPPNDG